MKKLLLLGLTIIGTMTLNGCDLQKVIYGLNGVEQYSYAEFLNKMSKLESPYTFVYRYDNHGNPKGNYSFNSEDHGWYNTSPSELEEPLYLEAYYFAKNLHEKTTLLGEDINERYHFGYIKSDKVYQIALVTTKEEKEQEVEYKAEFSLEGMLKRAYRSSLDENGEFKYDYYDVFNYLRK